MLSEITEDEIKEMITNILNETKRFNDFSKQIRIEFAYGYAFSTSIQGADLKVLFKEADRKMYEYKARMKEEKQVSLF